MFLLPPSSSLAPPGAASVLGYFPQPDPIRPENRRGGLKHHPVISNLVFFAYALGFQCIVPQVASPCPAAFRIPLKLYYRKSLAWIRCLVTLSRDTRIVPCFKIWDSNIDASARLW